MKGYCGMEIPFTPREVSVDGMVDKNGVEFYGKATLQEDGTWRCYANVHGLLCIVEVSITEAEAA